MKTVCVRRFRTYCAEVLLSFHSRRFSACSDEVREQGFTVVIDMRGATWSTVKPILKVLQEHFPGSVHIAYIIKPDNFWQKQRTSLGSHKYKFEVSVTRVERFKKWAELCWW
jgi:CRAL/TRIO domain.